MTHTESAVDSVAIVIFGASGDLTSRKLIPALHTLACEGHLPKTVLVLGVARSSFTDQAFRDELYKAVEEYSRSRREICKEWTNFAPHVSYLSGNYDGPETYRRISETLARFNPQQGNCLFYLATPPILDACAEEYFWFAWQLRHEAFLRFGSDPDGIFSIRTNSVGFRTE